MDYDRCGKQINSEVVHWKRQTISPSKIKQIKEMGHIGHIECREPDKKKWHKGRKTEIGFRYSFHACIVAHTCGSQRVSFMCRIDMSSVKQLSKSCHVSHDHTHDTDLTLWNLLAVSAQLYWFNIAALMVF